MKKRNFLLNALMAGVLLINNIYAEPAPIATSNLEQTTLTLKQINATTGFNLQGEIASKLFFLPVLAQWNLDNIQLHFIIYHAALARSGINLTLYVNDNPISSTLLEGLIGSDSTWDVTLPKGLLSGQNINVKITSHAKDFDFNCYSLANQNYWVFISSDSTVTYHYIQQNYQPDLTKFPFPFINDPAIQKDTIVIALPDAPSMDNLAAAFYLANALYKHQSWRGIDIVATSISQLTPEQKQKNNIIFVGTPSEFNFNSTATKWPLSINANNQIITKDGNSVAANTGVILLATSPWNPQQAILAITGNSDAAVTKAAQAIGNPEFTKTVLFNEYALVMQTPTIKNITRLWNNSTFSDLGFKDQVTYGVGESTLSYLIDLPTKKTPLAMNLDLSYGVSPFLSQSQGSFITLKINDLPITGTTIVNQDAQNHWKVRIDGSKLNVGKNNLSFTFNLKLKNHECTPNDASLAWATIFADSTIDMEFDKQLPYLSFNTFSDSAQNVIAILNDNGFHDEEALYQQQLLSYAASLSHLASIKFTTTKQFNPNIQTENDLIYIGNIDDNPQLAAKKSTLPFYYSQQKLVVNPYILPYVSISDETPVAILQLIPSPFNPQKLMLLLTALNDDGYRLGFELLNNPKKYALINGNVVLAYANGTFTSLQSQRLVAQAINQDHIKNIGNIVYIVGSIVVVAIVALILGLIIYRRMKHYFTPKE